MKRNQLAFFGLLVAVIALVLAACGGGGDSTSGETTAAEGGETTAAEGGGGEPRTVYLNQYTREIPYFQEIVKGMDTVAGELGWTIEKTYGNADPAQQVDQIQNAIVTDPDAMVVIPIDEDAITPVMLQATEAGIPVAAMGDDTADEAARDFFLGVDYTAMGEEKAEYVVEQLGGKGTVGFIHGIRGLNFTERQNEGASKVFEENPGITVIDGPYTGGFSSDLGLNATENLLAREPNIDAVYFDNDDLALGGVQAIDEAGIAKEDILVVGTDGGPAALEAVKNGEIDYTLSLCGFKQGKEVVDILHEQLDNGVEPESTILTETLEFTAETFAEHIKIVEEGEC